MRAEPIRDLSDLRDYSLRPDRAQLRRWLIVAVVFALGFLCGAATAYGAEPCVRLRVRPQIMTSRNDIDVQVRVARHADHRRLRVEWQSETGWAGSSERTLDGAGAAVRYQFWLAAYPPATYDFFSTVTNGEGRVVGRDRARILAPNSEDQ